MSSGNSPSYSPTTNRDSWVELEVPYGLYRSNWTNEHKDRLKFLVEKSNILKRHFTPHWELSQTDPIGKKSVAIDKLASSEPEWAAAILSGYEFARNTNKDHVLTRLDNVKPTNSSDPLKSHVETALSNSDKKFAVLLLDLIDPDRLKDIYVLSRLRRRSPVTTLDVSGTNSPIGVLDQNELLNEFDDKSRNFNVWHEFNSNGHAYLVVKIHDEDSVMIQPDTNAEVEQADLLILKAVGNEVQVYAPTNNLVGATQRGIQKGINAGNNQVSNCTVTPSDTSISPQDYDDAVDEIKSNNLGSNLMLHKLTVKNTPLSGSPKVRLSDSANGLSGALNELRGMNIELLDDPDSIEQIGFRFQGRAFTLYPETEGTTVRLRYQGSINDDQLLDDFEQEVENHLDVSVVFERK